MKTNARSNDHHQPTLRGLHPIYYQPALQGFSQPLVSLFEAQRQTTLGDDTESPGAVYNTNDLTPNSARHNVAVPRQAPAFMSAASPGGPTQGPAPKPLGALGSPFPP